MHILGNMWFLWIFGNNVEDAMGKVKFTLFYIAGGIAAAAAQVALGPTSPVPMVGASGAIGGVLGAYLVLYPGSRVVTLITAVIITTVELPAFIILGFWFVLQVLGGFMGMLGPQEGGGTAYGAHVGGFVFGMVTGRLLAAVHPPRHDRYRDGPGSMDWR
jgi:membrane associated rhomboid family serine protease